MAIETVASITTTTVGIALPYYGKVRTIAIDSNGRLYVAYADIRAGYTYAQIYVSYSDDGGATWIEEQVTDVDTTDDHYEAAIAIDSTDILHLVYHYDWEVLYQQRSALGVWSAVETVASTEVGEYSKDSPAIAIDSSDNVHVVYTEDTIVGSTRLIRYRKRSGTWGAIETVAETGTYMQRQPAIAIDSSDYVHVVWAGLGWGTNITKFNIRYHKRTTSWQTAEAITDTTEHQELPSIAIDSSDIIHVAWDGETWGTNTTIANVQYRQRTTSWQTVEHVTDDATKNRYPSIAVDSNSKVWVAWEADTPGSPSIHEINIRSRNGSWGTVIEITDGSSKPQSDVVLLWAMHPTANAIASYWAVWLDWATAIKFGYALAVALAINKAYALSREEL